MDRHIQQNIRTNAHIFFDHEFHRNSTIHDGNLQSEHECYQKSNKGSEVQS